MSSTVQIALSESLRRILHEIEPMSQIAQLLLKEEHQIQDLVEDYVNYISISKDDPTKISYLTKERILKVKDNLWESPQRFHCRPGSFVSRLFKNISPREIEKFANLFKSIQSKQNHKLQVVEGEDIKKYYFYKNYLRQEGSLGNSCMKNEHNQKTIDFYIHNDVKMLILIDDEGLLIGRALLWNINGQKIMDRIYTISDEEYTYTFKQWAIKNDYIYKREQKWNSTLDFENNGKKVTLKLELNLRDPFFSKFPYIDTFKWIDLKRGKLFNYRPDENLEDIRVCCSSDGATMGEDYLIYDDLDGYYFYNADMPIVRYLDTPIRTNRNNLSYSEIHEMYILNRDAIWVESLRDHIFKTELDHLNNKEAIEERRKQIEQYEEKCVRRKDYELAVEPLPAMPMDYTNSSFEVIVDDSVSDNPDRIIGQ